ncbi:16S rRNA (cytosine(967)-C(5))-methyltransferase [Spirulina subsalsa FACHB-351]|uniref:16S rRNA (cytosine(967)-C(5))-methyltransferase n=1 Tax=Spirulina subsalsa FACHB-351 TaxID=234711 RepID=A0ABT3L0L4_9CYAN|nr:16S rRNA (cytosine(967)-C(5))-methyltransferase [Spirulina subsalsa]MCW6035039.1 16S rRNA (cytosine(967)-C(5))-methyltransferase [Spirulina subsalsa FACHB-351]
MNARQLAFLALKQIDRQSAYTDVVLDRTLRQQKSLKPEDRGLFTELVYGIVRRQRSLDALIDQLGKKKARQQPPDLRLILQIGLYQLRYLDHIPPSAAVNTTVELAKTNSFKHLSGVVNGILRQYERLAQEGDPLKLPRDPIPRLGLLHSFPDWIIQLWWEEWGEEETEKLCIWFNKTPYLDLRINPLQTTREAVQEALNAQSLNVYALSGLPQGLRVEGKTGPIALLPGYGEGWWTVQDGSAQLVAHLLDPQPGEVVIDACAAPGGKTTHIAELMGDRGEIWACDRALKRLNHITGNQQRLKLHNIQTCGGDSRQFEQFIGKGDRVLLDAPCSGLGTLHRHPDIRWRQTPEKLAELVQLQRELLNHTATWVKPGGCLVYSTCTLNPQENEALVQDFLATHPQWHLQPPPPNFPVQNPAGWVKILPTKQDMDGFFMAKLVLEQ